MIYRKEAPIAVLDSGVGGISVLRELKRQMPSEDFLFFGDEKNAPYGTKSQAQVREITLENVRLLTEEKGAKAVVIACNTATGAALREVRQAFPDLIAVGIEPEIKSAALLDLPRKPRVLVMATPLTLKQEKFLTLLARFEENAEFTLLPCPGLMELIEAGHVRDSLLDGYLASLFSTFDNDDFDAVVLGCTHYPHIKREIKTFFPSAQLFDGCRGTAAETLRRLKEKNLCQSLDRVGTVTFSTSAQNADFQPLCHRLSEL